MLQGGAVYCSMLQCGFARGRFTRQGLVICALRFRCTGLGCGSPWCASNTIMLVEILTWTRRQETLSSRNNDFKISHAAKDQFLFSHQRTDDFSVDSDFPAFCFSTSALKRDYLGLLGLVRTSVHVLWNPVYIAFH